MRDLLDEIKPEIDRVIGDVEKTKYRIDPIVNPKISRTTSIVSAAYKKHGRILELALLKRLERCSYFEVWTEAEFKISDTADRAIRGRNTDIEHSLPIALPYGEPGRRVQVDIIVYDDRVRTVRAYEVKRGNGKYDAGKTRSILRDLLSIQSLLKSYGETKGFDAGVAEARLVSYFGSKIVPPPMQINGLELDDHFVYPVRKFLDDVNAYYAERLAQTLRAIVGLSPVEAQAVCDSCPLRNYA